MKRPNFFIVGAPKCGTTALSQYLSEHQLIYHSDPKELHFFSRDISNYSHIKSLSHYLNYFAPATDQHIAVGEASVWYLYSEVAPKLIKEFNGQAKIIIMVRNPLEMIPSLHSQLLYSCDENVEDLLKAFYLEEKRSKGLGLPPKTRNKKLLYYSKIAKYGEQIERWLTFFHQDKIKIVFFEDFVNQTFQTYNNILSFLNVPADNRDEFPVINPNKRLKSKKIGSFLKRLPKPIKRLREQSSKFQLNNTGLISFFNRLNTVVETRKKMDEKLKMTIIEAYQEDIRKLSAITCRNLDNWLI